MYFLGSANRTRGHYEKSKVAFAMQPSIIFFLTDLDPDGCLVADQLKGHAIHLRKRVQKNKRVTSALVGDPAKNYTIFAMHKYFLLTGAF